MNIYRKISMSEKPNYNFSHSSIHHYDNLGGEVLAYLQYIFFNYENLPEYLFFSPANLSTYWPFGENLLDNMIDLFVKYNVSYVPIANKFGLETFDHNGCCYSVVKKLHNSLINYEKLRKKSIYTFHVHPYSNAFFVSKYAIKRRSKNFYLNLLNDIMTIDKILIQSGIERSWWFIFDENDISGIFSLYKLCKYKYENIEFLTEICKLYKVKPALYGKLFYTKELLTFYEYYNLISSIVTINDLERNKNEIVKINNIVDNNLHFHIILCYEATIGI